MVNENLKFLSDKADSIIAKMTPAVQNGFEEYLKAIIVTGKQIGRAHV